MVRSSHASIPHISQSIRVPTQDDDTKNALVPEIAINPPCVSDSDTFRA